MPYTIEQIQNVSSRVQRTLRHRDEFPEWLAASVISQLRGYDEDSRFETNVALYAQSTIECEGCGEVVAYVDANGEVHYRDQDDAVEFDGMTFCRSDCAYESGYDYCQRCGEWGHTDNMVYIEDVGYYCDSYCAERDGFVRCGHCGEWVCGYDAFAVVSSGVDQSWCESCYDLSSRSCCSCGTSYDEDDMTRDGYGDCYCPDCSSGESAHLHSYGHTPFLNFFDHGDPDPLYLGIELETDGGSQRGSYCDELHELEVGGRSFRRHFWMTEDSSLDNGVEITGHPMTLGYVMAMSGMFEQIRQVAERYGFRSHDGGNCGLHVHVNKSFFGSTRVARENAYFRLLRLLQRHERKFYIFSRRQSTRWCEYKTLTDYAAKDDVVRILPHESQQNVFDKARHAAGNSFHSQCIGFRAETLEFRIFRGTLKLSTLYASLAMVDGLCRAVREHGSYWCESVSWYDLMDEVVERTSDPTARECLANYLDEKGLR